MPNQTYPEGQPPTETKAHHYNAAMNRLAKWRVVFCGWFMGTRPDTDQQAKAYKDLIERTLLMRAELSAVNRILVEKEIVGASELMDYIEEEAAELEKILELRFPGYKASEHGIDIDVELARKTSEGWPA